MVKTPRDCPCHSGRRYKECCGPLHAGAVVAPSPETLMRSRYAAYALGLGRYLTDTLAEDHPDRAHPPAELARELGRAKDRQRFVELRIVHAAEAGDRGEVLFFAGIFERGDDRSFAELSEFTREHGRWRYASGVMVPRPQLPADLTSMDRDAFLALAAQAAT